MSGRAMKMNWYLLLALGVVMLCLGGLSVFSEDALETPPPLLHQNGDAEGAAANQASRLLPKVTMILDGEAFDLEVAMTTADALRGLMYRTHLKANQGMLFSFSPARAVNFWMKNTLIPLDMIFIRNHQVVHVVHEARPCPASLGMRCPTYSSVLPVDMVVELPAGTAKKLAVVDGDIVAFEHPANLKPAEPTVIQIPPKPAPKEPVK